MYVSRTLPAALESAWTVVGDFHGVPSWIKRMRDSTAEGGHGHGAVGSIRRLTVDPDGREVRERLVAYDGRAHRLSYEFVGENPYRVSAFLATVQLRSVTRTAATFVSWSCEFDAEPARVDRLRDAFTALFTEFIGDLSHHLADAPRHFPGCPRGE